MSRKGRPPSSSLARGQDDCRTCVARRWQCDRVRPRCDNCQKSGKICGGFTMQLSWQPGFSTHRKPVKRSVARRPRWRVSVEDESIERRFEFISERPAAFAAIDRSALTPTSPRAPAQAVCDAELHLPSDSASVSLCPSQSIPFFLFFVLVNFFPLLLFPIQGQSGTTAS